MPETRRVRAARDEADDLAPLGDERVLANVAFDLISESRRVHDWDCCTPQAARFRHVHARHACAFPDYARLGEEVGPTEPRDGVSLGAFGEIQSVPSGIPPNPPRAAA